MSKSQVIPFLNGLLHCLLLAVSFNMASCKEDWKEVRCGPRGKLGLLSEDGPCGRCPAEDGLFAMGDRGQFCFEPLECSDLTKLLTFARPLPFTPVDSFIVTFHVRESAGNPESLLEPIIAVPLIFSQEYLEEWDAQRCDTLPRGQRTHIAGFCCGIVGFELSERDTLFSEGKSFLFNFGITDINGDCLTDHAWTENGRIENGVGVADLFWYTIDGVLGGPPIRHDTVYLHPLPSYMCL